MNRRYLRTVILCIVALGITYALRFSGKTIPADYFLQLHLVLEYSSVVVSFAVFAAGWVGYKQTNNSRDLILALTFLAAGTLDFIHTLSYRGMPDFLGINTTGKAAAYWLLARLIVGAGLLVAAIVSPEARSRRLSAKAMVAASIALIVAAVVVLTVYGGPIGNALYDPAMRSLTPLKIALEYICILAYAAAFVAISEKRGWDARSAEIMRTAILVAIFAEIAFTGYSTPYDWQNALGHIFKTISYYLILSGIFISAIVRPYDQLSRTKEELQALYLDAREHRKEIERSFVQIGNALSSSLDVDAALDQICELSKAILHADCAIVASLDEPDNTIRAAAQKGGCRDSYRPAELAVQIGHVAIERKGVVTLDDLEALDLVNCDPNHPDCLRSMVCAPMICEDHALGVIAIFSHGANAFDAGAIGLLEGFAAHAAVAIRNALSYARESRIADVLQRSFLSTAVPLIDKFEIAQVYESAANEALIGGDFYDVIDMDDGRIGLVIGDVSGKGLKAAVHTAMVKYTLRAYVKEGHSPAKVMKLLNAAVSETSGSETFVTTFFGVLDPKTGEMIYTNAGHEPPIHSFSGRLDTLDSNGPALGLGIDMDYEESTLILEPGSILLMYTDGISEARRGSDLLGTERIGEVLLKCTCADCGNIAKCVHSAAVDFAGGELKDDAAILAVRAKDIYKDSVIS
ncbi:MAG: MASE3 domain-containing protein [Armatimonadota bacterium]|nr:SpoIIE family protein phosphatase [bacterium]